MLPSDERLMRRYAAGDDSAFRLLFSRYERKIYNFFMRRIGNVERAADLFQETFLRLHQNRHRFDSSRPFAPWLYTIANNLVRDELRMKRGIQFDVIEEESLPPSMLATLEESMAATEIVEKVELALKILPESQREVLLLSKSKGLTHRQIAEITSRSEAAVKQLLYRGLQNLKRHLAEA